MRPIIYLVFDSNWLGLKKRNTGDISEDLDFADDLALLSHSIKDMIDNTKNLYERQKVHV